MYINSIVTILPLVAVLQPVGTIQPEMHSSTASKQYISTWASETDFLQTVKFIKSTLQLKHSLKFNKTLSWHSCTFRHSSSNMNYLLCSICNCCLLLTEVLYNVAIQCTIYYKLIKNLINTVCIHSSSYKVLQPIWGSGLLNYFLPPLSILC